MRELLLKLIICLSVVTCSERSKEFRKDLILNLHHDQGPITASANKSLSIPIPQLNGDINCVGVFIGYPGGENGDSCQVGASVIRFNEIGGLSFSNDNNFEVLVRDVLVTTKARAHIIGFQVESAQDCPSLGGDPSNSDFEPGEGNVSEPYLIATRAFSTAAASSPTFDISASRVPIEIKDCSFEGDGGKSYRDLVIDDGPIEYWRMDEIFNGNMILSEIDDGSELTGEPILVVNNGAITSDSVNNAINIPASSPLESQSGIGALDFAANSMFTLEMWVLGIPGATSLMSNFGASEGWKLKINANKVVFEMKSNVGSETLNHASATVLDTSPDTWNHIVMTYDGTLPNVTINLIINGAVNSGTPPRLTNNPKYSTFLSIGGSKAMSVDEVAIYDKVLSVDQALEHYNAATNALLEKSSRGSWRSLFSAK